MDPKNLRLLSDDIPLLSYMVDDNKVRRPGGFVGNIYYSFWGSHLHGFNVTYTSVVDSCSIHNLNYSAKVCALYYQTHDATMRGYSMTTSLDIISYLDNQYSGIGIIMHTPELNEAPLTIIETFNVFHKLVWWSIFFGMMSIFAIAFIRKKQSRASISDILQCIYRSYLNQSQIKRLILRNTAISLALLLSSYLVLLLIGNLVRTEMIAKDYSKVINSLEDLWRLKQYTPCLNDGDPYTALLSESESRLKRDIWSRVIKTGYRKSLMKEKDSIVNALTIQKHYAFLGQEESIMMLFRIHCAKQNKKPKVWKAEKALGDLRYAYYVSRNISKEKRAVLERRSRQVTEGRFFKYLTQRALNGVPGIPSSPICEKGSLDELFDDHSYSVQIQMSMLVPLLKYLILALLISLIVLVKESTEKPIIHVPVYKYSFPQ